MLEECLSVVFFLLRFMGKFLFRMSDVRVSISFLSRTQIQTDLYEEDLETVVPKQAGAIVMVVRGELKGRRGKMVEVRVSPFSIFLIGCCVILLVCGVCLCLYCLSVLFCLVLSVYPRMSVCLSICLYHCLCLCVCE